MSAAFTGCRPSCVWEYGWLSSIWILIWVYPWEWEGSLYIGANSTSTSTWCTTQACLLPAATDDSDRLPFAAPSWLRQAAVIACGSSLATLNIDSNSCSFLCPPTLPGLSRILPCSILSVVIPWRVFGSGIPEFHSRVPTTMRPEHEHEQARSRQTTKTAETSKIEAVLWYPKEVFTRDKAKLRWWGRCRSCGWIEILWMFD